MNFYCKKKHFKYFYRKNHFQFIITVNIISNESLYHFQCIFIVKIISSTFYGWYLRKIHVYSVNLGILLTIL